MSRSLWFVAGAGAGVWAAARARRAAEALTADGLRDRLGALAVGARIFRDEVATGSAERETELRRRYGLGPPGGDRPELAARPQHTDQHIDQHTDEHHPALQYPTEGTP